MTYPICWEPTRVQAVLTTESRQKSRDLFLQTHLPFRQIRVDFCKEEGITGEFISEEQVRALIQAGPLNAHNRLFFVVGEAGSGKSELCQWLEYTVDRNVRLPIHIPRSMTSAAHVVALLRQHIGGTAAVLQRAPIALQADYIALSAVVLLYEHDHPLLMPLVQWERFLNSTPLKQAIAAHLEAANQGHSQHRLLGTVDELATISEQCGLALRQAELPALWTVLQTLLAQALEQTLWLGDLRELLSRLAEQALTQGRRPLLLLEDITAFRILGDRLLDYLLDLTSGHFDALIGVTTGFEQTQLAGATLAGDLTHIHHRLRARFVLTDDQGRSYGLEEDAVACARSYLRAIKHDCSSCLRFANCQAIFGPDLYPFTATALQRAFQCLQEEGTPRQTPRLLLEHVLGAVLLAETIPPLALERSAYLTEPPLLFRSDEVSNGHLRSLLRWYGQVEETQLSLDRRIADFWDIPIDAQLMQGDQICVSRTYLGLPPTASEIPPNWQQELREVQRWLSVGGTYPSRETLKRGIERVLFSLGDPRSLASPDALSLAKAELYYARGDERIPIYLGRNSGDQPMNRTTLKVKISGSAAERGILEELVYLALSESDLAAVCRNLALTLAWAKQHWEEYHAELRKGLMTQLGGITAEQLVLMTWQLLMGLRSMPNVDQLELHHHEQDIPYAARSPWSPAQHMICYNMGAALDPWYEQVRRLCIGMFTLRDTLIDQERYRAVLRNFDRDILLQQLAALPLTSLRSLLFKIRPGNQKLYDLLVPLQRYADALIRLDLHSTLHNDLNDLEQRVAHLALQGDIPMEHLRQQVSRLHWCCGEVGVTWHNTWDAALALFDTLTTDDLGALQIQMTTVLQDTREYLNTQAINIWSYQALRHTLRPLLQHPYWAAMTTLRTIQTNLLTTARHRYRGNSRTLTRTQAYQALLQTVRAIRQELRDGSHLTHR